MKGHARLAILSIGRVAPPGLGDSGLRRLLDHPIRAVVAAFQVIGAATPPLLAEHGGGSACRCAVARLQKIPSPLPRPWPRPLKRSQCGFRVVLRVSKACVSVDVL